MKIRLDRLHHEPFVWQEVVELPLASLDRPELVELGPVECRGELVPAHPGFLLRIGLSYRQKVTCDRCLQPVEEAIESPLELLVEQGGHDPAEERELADDDLGTMRVEGDTLDTEPLILEQMQLNVPMKPLCRPDCRGLCPTCGTDLNRETCACTPAGPDPRWAALAALRGRAGDTDN